MDIYLNDSFVYIWTNIENGKKYIGVHKGTPFDGYICSSKLMLEAYNKNPQNFKREIVAFGQFDQMLRVEHLLLESVDAKNNNLYYNLHNGNGKFLNKKHTEQTKIKIGMANSGKPGSNLGKKFSDEHKQKIRNSKLGCKNPNYGKSPSEETMRKRREAMKYFKHTEEAKEKIRQAWVKRKQKNNS